MAKILLIDDDKLMIKMYQGKFEDDGFDVAIAFDGESGFNKALEYKPDIILLDIMMPKVNGLEMLKKLKNNPITKKTPVILLTNVGGSDQDIEEGLSMGAVAYLVKAHYDAKDVVKKVKEVLGGYVDELPKVEVKIKAESDRKEKKKNKQKLEEIEKKLEEVKKELKEDS